MNDLKSYIEMLIKQQSEKDAEFKALLSKPNKSIEEFRAEGKMMHHCVFDMGYYKKPDCLILSAQVNGKHMETIELNLKNFSIVQCRGFMNDPSAYHNEIVQLMNKNMYKVRQLTKKRKEVA